MVRVCDGLASTALVAGSQVPASSCGPHFVRPLLGPALPCSLRSNVRFGSVHDDLRVRIVQAFPPNPDPVVAPPAPLFSPPAPPAPPAPLFRSPTLFAPSAAHTLFAAGAARVASRARGTARRDGDGYRGTVQHPNARAAAERAAVGRRGTCSAAHACRDSAAFEWSHRRAGGTRRRPDGEPEQQRGRRARDDTVRVTHALSAVWAIGLCRLHVTSAGSARNKKGCHRRP